MKLNFDGAAKRASKRAGCGGLLRNECGRWLGGFAKKLGICFAMNVEFWRILWGMKMASELGIINLVVEGDSLAVINRLQGSCINDIENCRLLIDLILQ